MKILCIDGENRGRYADSNGTWVINVPYPSNFPFFSDLNKEPEQLTLEYQVYHIREINYGTSIVPEKHYVASINPYINALQIMRKMEKLISELMSENDKLEYL